MNISNLSMNYFTRMGIYTLADHKSFFDGIAFTQQKQISLDKTDISMSSLLKSRILNFKHGSKPIAELLPADEQNTITDPQKLKFIELGKTVAKPIGIDIDDYKWGIMVALGNEVGITDGKQIAQMNIKDVQSNLTLYSPEVVSALSAPLRVGNLYVPESVESSDLTDTDVGIIFFGDLYYNTPDKYEYDGMLSNADTESLLMLLEGVQSSNGRQIQESVELMRNAGVLKETVTYGQSYHTPMVDRQAVDNYYKASLAIPQPEGINLNAYTWGLLNELGAIIGTYNPEELVELTYNDLSSYIEQYKNNNALQVPGMANTMRDAGTKLSDMTPYSLYCIVEGIKKNDGAMFNEGLIIRAVDKKDS